MPFLGARFMFVFMLHKWIERRIKKKHNNRGRATSSFSICLEWVSCCGVCCCHTIYTIPSKSRWQSEQGKRKKKSLNENKGTIIGHEDDLLQIIKAEQEQQRVFIEASRRRKNKAEKCVKINHKPRALFGYSFCQTSGWRLISERNSKLVQTRVIVFFLRGCGCAIKSNFRLSPSESTLPQVD